MSARFEIVRGSVAQPWHARLVSNGRILMSSETYARKVGAERAVLSIARALVPVRGGGCVDHLKWNVAGVEKVIVDQWDRVVDGAPLVKYLDERTGAR
jgi:uncharacterized protein YegP (UPF0339 family)